MATQIEIQGQVIEINEPIKYTYQVNDIAGVSDRQASYTNSFKLPRTAEVVALFEGLGIAGDTSTAPYRKVSCRLFDNYAPVMEKGWLQVRHTDDRYYHVAVYSGVIDFFKAIENKTTEDLDFSDLDHDKDVDSIVATWENDLPYRYFIADYGAGDLRTYREAGTGPETIDAGALQPAFKISWLWDKIFQKYGFTYSGNIFASHDFNSRYITYPKNRAQASQELVATLRKVDAGPYTKSGPFDQSAWRPFLDGNVDNRYEFFPAEGENVITGNPDGWSVRILKEGYYRFEFLVNCECEIFEPFTGPENKQFVFEATGIPPNPLYLIDSNTTWEQSYIRQVEPGTVVDFLFNKTVVDQSRIGRFTINDFTVNIYKLVSDATPDEALLKIGLTEFFKEVLWMFGLTAIPDKYSNNIHFLTPQERFTTAQTVDWSRKYVRRVKEEYVYGYARENYLRHRYLDENDQSFDGVIRVNDENLKESETLITSNFMAPNRFAMLPFLSGIQARSYPFLTITEKDGEETDEFESGRHFLIAGRLQDVSVRMGMKGLPGSAKVAGPVYVESFGDTSYETTVSRYYQPMEDVLNDTRIHTIELCLSPADVGELDFTKLYFFSQEGNYYLLNKLRFEPGKFATGEFVRVKITRKAGEFSDAFSSDFNI